jgi:predicted NUDIX family NTP pyrophosphohydrolase
MVKSSAGILMYRHDKAGLLVLLVHPGGPFWRNRDAGAWSIPKGEFDPAERPDAAARREFAEELGTAAIGELKSLGHVRQRGGKHIEAFALDGHFDVTSLRSNTFEIEWPPHTGRVASFPEIDRAAWFTLPVAREKILAGQLPFLDRLEDLCVNRP